MMQQPLQVSWPWAILAVVAMLFGGVVVGSLATEKASSCARPGEPLAAGEAEPPADAPSLATGFRGVVRKALPAVVNI